MCVTNIGGNGRRDSVNGSVGRKRVANEARKEEMVRQRGREWKWRQGVGDGGGVYQPLGVALESGDLNRVNSFGRGELNRVEGEGHRVRGIGDEGVGGAGGREGVCVVGATLAVHKSCEARITRLWIGKSMQS